MSDRSERPLRRKTHGHRRRRPSVERLEGRQLLTTYVVTSTADSGPATLRRAINNSNGDTAQANVITFNLGGTGVQTISLLSALPAITQAVSIEGTTDSSGNPLVELNGAGAGSTASGLTVQADNTTVEGLVIEQFGGDGIDVSGINDLIAGNDIGIPDITTGDGNGGWGVVITGSNDQIGRTTAGTGNDITGNGAGGVRITGAGATGNLVQGNNLGLGMKSGNTGDGILIDAGASGNRIGTNGDGVNDDAEANAISYNGAWGVEINGVGTAHNVVAGNEIGTGPHGGAAFPNGSGGVLIHGGASNNLIGTDGSSFHADEGNLISGNNGQGAPGLMISDQGTDFNVVAGNLIGTNGAGQAAMGNGNNGVWIADGAQSNRIGMDADDVDAAAEDNVLSANSYSGVSITDPGTDFNTVAGNYIGTANDGTTLLGNASDGISIRGGAQSNTVGGAAGLGNLIRANGGSGVAVYDNATTGNTIRFNEMRGNGGLGIDLGGDGVTADHGNMAAKGPNQVQNYPTITSAGDGTTTTVGISLVGLPNTTYTVDFYSSGGADPSGYGEGFGHLGNVTVTTDANGQAVPPTTFNLAANTNPNAWITATATDPAGNTSEFSKAWQVSSLATQVIVTPSLKAPGYGQSLSFTATVAGFGTALPTPTGTVQFLVDGQAFGTPVSLVGGSATSASTHVLAAGGHTIGAVYSGDPTYTTFTQVGSQTIAPAVLTLTADNKSKVYGGSEPTLTYSVAGLVNGDGPSVVSGVTLATDTGPAATAGTHPIAVNGGTAANYTIIDVAGVLSVSKAALTVKADDEAKIYGAADPALTYTATGTLYYGDTSAVIGGVTLATATGAAATAGTHDITASGGTAANYAIADVNGSLFVSPASLKLTADDKNKVFGAADPVLTYSVTGLAYGDGPSVVGGVSLSTATGAAATAGTHAISISGGTAANYTINDVGGTLTVAPAPLTVTADDRSKVFGAADPALTYTASGPLYYGDTYAVIGGVTLTTATGAAATVGSHPIKVSGGTAANYAITDVDGTLTVTPAPDQNPAGGGDPSTPPPAVTVTGVTPILNKKHQVIQIRISFSGTLDAAGAQSTGSYRLVTAGKKNSFTARNARSVALSSSTYDAASETVTLTPGKAFAIKKPVQVTIMGQATAGLRDGSGRPIDGNRDGQPGGNAVAVINRGRVSFAAVVAQPRAAALGVVDLFGGPEDVTHANDSPDPGLTARPRGPLSLRAHGRRW